MRLSLSSQVCWNPAVAGGEYSAKVQMQGVLLAVRISKPTDSTISRDALAGTRLK